MRNKKVDDLKAYLQSYLEIHNNIETIENMIFSSNEEHAKLIQNLEKLLQEKNEKCYNILTLITSLDSEIEKNLMTLKYLLGYTWEAISETTNYSLRQVYNIHNRALSKLLYIYLQSNC